jgi:hypothetical protein
MENRRADDKVNGEGEPISAAHQAIYEHITQCRDEIIADRGRISKERIDEHEKLHHHPPLSKLAADVGKSPTQLMREFIAAAEVSGRVVDALEGPEVTNIAGESHRAEESGLVWQVADIQSQMSNGVRHKAELSKGQWTAITALITALGTIAVGLVT